MVSLFSELEREKSISHNNTFRGKDYFYLVICAVCTVFYSPLIFFLYFAWKMSHRCSVLLTWANIHGNKVYKAKTEYVSFSDELESQCHFFSST